MNQTELSESPGEVTIFSLKEGNVAYSFSGSDIYVAVNTSLSGVDIVQNKKTLALKPGIVVGNIDFYPFNIGEPSSNPVIDILRKGSQGIKMFVEEVEKRNLTKPEIFISHTNFEMARVAAKLGFSVPGFYNGDAVTAQEMKQIFKKIKNSNLVSITITTNFENLKRISGRLMEFIK